MIDNANQTERGRGQPYGLRKAIEEVKGAVPIEDYAAEFTQLQQNGHGLRGCCPVHGGDNPQSFAVYPKERRFYCFRCNEGGDVIDLAQAVEGGEVWEAMYSLAQRYAVDLPQRGDTWHEWQNEKGKRRRMIREALADSYQRRFFRVFGGHLSDVADPEEYEREATAFFDGLRRVAKAAARNRMSR